MSNRQDRQAARTPADLERKYNFGARFAEIMGVLNSHRSAQEAVSAETDALHRELEDLKGEYAQDSAEMQETVGGIKDDMRVTEQELINAKNELGGNIDDIRTDLVPLAEFSDGGYSGIAGFVARANADSTSIGILLEYAQDNDVALATFMAEAAKEFARATALAKLESDTNNSIAGVRQEATATFATITSLTAIDTKHTNALAGLEQEVSKTYATIEALASFEDEAAEAIASVRQEASGKYATIESLASLETETATSIAGFKSEVEGTYAKQSDVVAFNTAQSNALAGLERKVTGQYATQEFVTGLNTAQSNALAGFKADVSKTYATQDMLTALETANSVAFSNFRQEVSKGYVSNTQIAGVVDTNGKLTASTIVQAINDAESSILLSADRIDLEGYVTFSGLRDGETTIDGSCIKKGTIPASLLDSELAKKGEIPTNVSDLSNDAGYAKTSDLELGVTTINGNCITTGIIKSRDYGMTIDLDEGEIRTPNFSLDSSGNIALYNAYAQNILCENADVRGKITSSDGSLGRVAITSEGLTCGDTYLTSGGIHTSNGSDYTLIAGGVIRFGENVSIYAPKSSVSGAFLGVNASSSWRTLYFDEETHTVKFI